MTKLLVITAIALSLAGSLTAMSAQMFGNQDSDLSSELDAVGRRHRASIPLSPAFRSACF